MTADYKQSLTEVDTILQFMNEDLTKKLPVQLIEFIKDNKDNYYVPKIDSSIPIDEQRLKPDTMILLSLLYRNYWCDENKRYEFRLQENMISTYEGNFVPFRNMKEFTDSLNVKPIYKVEETQLVKKEDINWFQKLLNKFKSIFSNDHRR